MDCKSLAQIPHILLSVMNKYLDYFGLDYPQIKLIVVGVKLLTLINYVTLENRQSTPFASGQM